MTRTEGDIRTLLRLQKLEQRNEEYAKQVGHMPSLRLAPIREP